MPDTDNLDVIAPPVRTVRIGRGEFELRPLTIGQIPPLMRTLKQISGSLDGTAIDFANLDAAQLITLAADHGDTLIDAVVVATGQPLEVIAAGTVDEFVDLFAQVVEVNSDFFVQRVLPQFQATLQRVRAKAVTQAPAGRGPIPLRR
jgi:hypothetical protein